MVYLTAGDLGWRCYVKTWIEETYTEDFPLDDELKTFLWDTFDQTVDIGLQKVRTTGKEPIKTDDLQLVRGITKFLTVLIDPQKGFKGDNKQKQ